MSEQLPFGGMGYPWAPANALTVARLFLSVEAANRIIKHEPHAAKVTGATFLTDFDGKLARKIEEHFPSSGWGVTEWGKIGDHSVDPVACSIVGGALAMSKYAHPAARAAGGLVCANEATKFGIGVAELIDMLRSGISFKEAMQFARRVDISHAAKTVEAEKMLALTLGALTCDTTNKTIRRTAGTTALGLATHGAVMNAHFIRGYHSQLVTMRNDK